jgi:DNA-directed RNA polymerase specialized sigma24 family protein
MLVEYHAKVKKDDFQILRNTVYNAHANLNRKKGEKEILLFDEEKEQEDDKEKLQNERDALFSEHQG